MKALLYTRVSHEEQVKFGYSLNAQMESLEQYCKDNNLTIKGRYTDEGVSGGSVKKRKALQRMLKEATDGDIILFTKLDRFSRNLLDANIIVQELEKKRVSIKAIHEDDIDTTTADGKFVFNLKLSLAQREREKTSERIHEVFAYKNSVGEVTTGSVPLGFKIENKRLVHDPEKKDIAIAIFKKFDETNNKGTTWNYINEDLGYKYSYRALSAMLTNEKYIGYNKGNPNFCEPLIDKALFNRVQEKLSRNVKTTPSSAQYIFSRLIVCPKCGKHFYASSTQTTQNLYHYYRCAETLTSHQKRCDCKTFVREDRMEKELIEKLPLFAKEEKQKLRKKSKTTNVENKIKSIKSKIDRTNEIYIDGMLDKDTYNRKISQFQTDLAELEQILNQRKNIALNEIIEFNFNEIYHMLSVENKSKFWHKYIKDIHIDFDGHLLGVEFFDE